MLILSDGKSFDGTLEEFRALAEAAQAENITISTIAFGDSADAELMSQIAEAGKGRYYAVRDANELPRILIYESQAARSENVQAGQTGLKLGEGEHPILSGLSLGQLPLLNGYNALMSKQDEGAENVLISGNFEDPILSAWQYGLGRVVAWMGDIGEEWTGSWAGDAQNKFWSQVVRYALVNPALGPAQVDVIVEDTEMEVETALFSAQGESLNLAQVSFLYAGADGKITRASLPQTRAGTYRLVLPRPPEGAYRGIVTYELDGSEPVEVAAPFVVNPPVEWLPVDPAVGRTNLAIWSQAGEGQVLPAAEIFTTDAEMQPEEQQPESDPLWWLLLALVLLWPLEIAIRRRWLPWS
jgi:hypothetical protein